MCCADWGRSKRATLCDLMTLERNLGEQPLAALLAQRQLTPNDLVRASKAQLTHKLVARAVKGRRLTAHSMKKVLAAFNAAAGVNLATADLFNYLPVEVAQDDDE
jgi:hypothetical protein